MLSECDRHSPNSAESEFGSLHEASQGLRALPSPSTSTHVGAVRVRSSGLRGLRPAAAVSFHPRSPIRKWRRPDPLGEALPHVDIGHAPRLPSSFFKEQLGEPLLEPLSARE
jgi:hypothetical protein